MAYALVGSVGTASGPTATTITPAFAQATSAGNLLIAWVVNAAAGVITTSSTGWTVAKQQAGTAAIFYRANCGASEAAPTFSGTGFNYAALAEFSGGATSSPVDQTGGLPTTPPITVVAAAADVATGELMVTCDLAINSKAGTETSSDTYNNGATPSGNLNNDAISVANNFRFAYGITTGHSAANQNVYANNSMNLTSGVAVIASFLLFTAGAAVIPDVGLALTVT